MSMAASNELRLFEDASDKQDVKNYLSLDNLVTRVKLGEVWQLGEHRLMCGDACKREDIELLLNGRKPDLVLQDPPYGMKCQKPSGVIGGTCINFGMKLRGKPDNVLVQSKVYPALIGDNNQNTARANYELIKDLCKLQIIWGGQYFAHFLPISGAWIF
ncbi:MAG: hypothetical protein II870_03475, partial [Synergistaceae bacterium]|nr:hypothetical protein [Synergistaceae bacterium]